MKRLIRIRSAEEILAMVNTRERIRDSAIMFSEEIANHIIKCVVYSKNSVDFNHWIHEVATWIFDVSNQKPKKGCKIRPEDYEEWLFSGFGDEISDVPRDLRAFHHKFVRFNDHPYPDFNITSDLCNILFDTVNQLREIVPQKMQKYESIVDVQNTLHSVLDLTCTHDDWLR